VIYPDISLLTLESILFPQRFQMVFLANEALTSPDRREAAIAFLEATFTGWEYAIRNPNEGIEAV